VKLIPRRSETIGRIVVKRILSTIVRPDETKNTTKFVLVDAVGPAALAAGIKVGDIVLPNKMGNIQLDGGVSFRPIVNEEDIRAIVHGVTLDELVVQTNSGSHFVPFGDKDAARSLCEDVPSTNGSVTAAPEARAC
jgi:co-chaperonin GroES (HSP10)